MLSTAIVKNANYNPSIINPVVDVPTTFSHIITEYTKVFTGASADGRSSIKY